MSSGKYVSARESDISTIKIFDNGGNINRRSNFSLTMYPNGTMKNQTSINNSTVIAELTVGELPEIFIWCFLGSVVVIGIFLNILAIYALFRAKCNGTRYFLLQLAFCDLGSLFICGLEVFYMNYRIWFMPVELCSVYLGFESFTSTAIIYFIIAINLHTISTYNLAKKSLRKRIFDYSTEQYSEHRASLSAQIMSTTTDNNDDYEIAISTPPPLLDSTQSTRSLTIDYSKRKNNIAVIMPALFVWFIAASSAIPLIVFGQVIPNERNPKICGIMNFDWYSAHLMQAFILFIRVTVPVICLFIVLIIACKKYLNCKNLKIDSVDLDENVKIILKLGLILGIVMFIFGIPKICGSLYFELITKPYMNYRFPKMTPLAGLIMSALSYFGSILRPIFYCNDHEIKSFMLFLKIKKKKKKLLTNRN